MPYWVYVLKSQSTGNFYTGQTSDLQLRLKRHNNPDVDTQRYTRKQKGPWELVYSEELSTRSDAMKKERFLKSGKGRTWIQDNIIRKR